MFKNMNNLLKQIIEWDLNVILTDVQENKYNVW